MDFKGIMLSEKVNQKVTYCMIPFIWRASNDKIREETDQWLPGVGVWG